MSVGDIILAAPGIGMALLWLWALEDAMNGPRLRGSQRVPWVVTIVALGIFGAGLYARFRPPLRSTPTEE